MLKVRVMTFFKERSKRFSGNKLTSFKSFFRPRSGEVGRVLGVFAEGFGVRIPAARSEVLKRIPTSLVYKPSPPSPIRNMFQETF